MVVAFFFSIVIIVITYCILSLLLLLCCCYSYGWYRSLFHKLGFKFLYVVVVAVAVDAIVYHPFETHVCFRLVFFWRVEGIEVFRHSSEPF